MAERPILFSAPMVRALLGGSKSQTRRVAKIGDWPERGVVGSFSPAPEEYAPEIFGAMLSNSRGAETLVPCPYGAPGDRLWVRETWAPAPPIAPLLRHVGASPRPEPKALYRANPEQANLGVTWRPSVHMPRWASRITLEVTGVRVERVQDISEEDARAEGIERLDGARHLLQPWRDYWTTHEVMGFSKAATSFRSLWESINGAGSWAANPWVWCLEFKLVTP
ncbi:MAG: hypothetical protein ACOZQL_10840 [Myxococcota bacterium]